MKINIQQNSIKGIRQTNQDYCSFFQDDNQFIAILCDGIGSLKNSECASKIIVETFINEFKVQKIINNPQNWFLKTLILSQEKIISYSTNHLKNEDIGSTLVLLMLIDNQYYLANIGDSRIYSVQNNQMNLLTTDHNYLNYLKEKQLDIPSDCNKNKLRALVSFIGTDLPIENVKYDFKKISNSNNLSFLLCSDGLYSYLDQKQILKILNDKNIINKSSFLNNEAFLSKSDDNISNIYIEIDNNGK